MRSQALGLATAVGLPIIEKRIGIRRPWAWMPGGLVPTPLSAISADSDPVEPPWPALVVACGRRSIGIALTVKRLSGGATLAAYVQNPEWGRSGFDLVAALPHDQVSGDNVVTLRTALHTVTRERLREARQEWRERLNPVGAPLLGVLVGGDNGRYRLTEQTVAQLIRILRTSHVRDNCRAAITPSRRTGDHAKRSLSSAFADETWAFFWDGREPNPYFGILGLADRLIVTGESISMISEALATGRPVHILPLDGQGRRHDAFLTRMADEGLVSIIEGADLDLHFSGTVPIDSAEEPARRLRSMLKLER